MINDKQMWGTKNPISSSLSFSNLIWNLASTPFWKRYLRISRHGVCPGPGKEAKPLAPLGNGEDSDDDGTVKLFSAVHRGHAAWIVSVARYFRASGNVQNATPLNTIMCSRTARSKSFWIVISFNSSVQMGSILWKMKCHLCQSAS